MGFGSFLKKLFGRKDKFRTLTAAELNESVMALENREREQEEEYRQKQDEIDRLMGEGKKTKDRQRQLFIAKKINMLRADMKNIENRIYRLLYNQTLVNQLKGVVADNEFYQINAGINMMELLADQQGLAKFLNESLGRRVKEDEMMTQSDELMQQIMADHPISDVIAAPNAADDSLLAMFEEESVVDMEGGNVETEKVAADAKEN